MSKKHKIPFSTSRLRNMCKAICSFDKHLRFFDGEKSSAIQYAYPDYPNKDPNWYDIAPSGMKGKHRRYVEILETVMNDKNNDEDTFYGNMYKNVPEFCCLEQLAIQLALRGL